MTLKLNRESAIAADSIASGIREAGKFVGVITRAEKLTSEKGTVGLGLSFKADNGQTADYLDLYHTKKEGDALSGLKTVNAVMCCAKVKEAKDGMIQCEKWNDAHGKREMVSVPGYPDLMGKRIGFLFQKTIEDGYNGGADRERIAIFGVFNAETELTASEMFGQKTKPERLSAMLDALLARPVHDKRKPGAKRPAASGNGGSSGGADDTRTGFSDDELDSCPF